MENTDFEAVKIKDLAKMIYSMSCNLQTVANNMHKLNTDVYDKIKGAYKKMSDLRNDIERRVIRKISKSIDKRALTEMNKKKKIVDEKIDDVIRVAQTEFHSNTDDAHRNISEIVYSFQNKDSIANNIIQRNVEETIK
ncbi:hypothetical protein DPMN_192571 [Dreissena polymorpha]|uniref:Uncharacterized protein n=1 Tax=Dreissena polymorpha TaxID=45954 RepID=A0A9D4BFS9_DREPO|nr:hypothetical protein DPMN_192571 [Dreissena polymorpha]